MSVTVPGHSYTLTTSTVWTLAKWNGDSVLTIEEMDELENHFAALVAGIEALGARYGVMALMLRMELKHVRRLRVMTPGTASPKPVTPAASPL